MVSDEKLEIRKTNGSTGGTITRREFSPISFVHFRSASRAWQTWSERNRSLYPLRFFPSPPPPPPPFCLPLHGPAFICPPSFCTSNAISAVNAGCARRRGDYNGSVCTRAANEIRKNQAFGLRAPERRLLNDARLKQASVFSATTASLLFRLQAQPATAKPPSASAATIIATTPICSFSLRYSFTLNSLQCTFLLSSASRLPAVISCRIFFFGSRTRHLRPPPFRRG